MGHPIAIYNNPHTQLYTFAIGTEYKYSSLGFVIRITVQ